jgi:hypothetical protein
MPKTSTTASRATDFDFAIGHWQVIHRRLQARLVGCQNWDAFTGSSNTRKILGGQGNLEDNLIHFPAGDVHAVALRSFNPTTGEWSIWWLDGRQPGQLDTPVVGRFQDGVGRFFADDVLNGVPIRVRFEWRQEHTDRLHWAQAFSSDAGQTWETNWTMVFSRAEGP